VADAIKAGKPDVLNIARDGASANRTAATGGMQKVPGKQLDEYPLSWVCEAKTLPDSNPAGFIFWDYRKCIERSSAKAKHRKHEFVDGVKTLMERCVATMPTYADFIARYARYYASSRNDGW
jgi:hypothetical protein